MDTSENYRRIIKNVLVSYTQIPYSHGNIQSKTVFDNQNDNYLLMTFGWDGIKRIHGCLVHIEIIDNKIWIQRDDTEDGITYDLEAVGIPKNQIVLGFHPLDVRKHTGYAVA